MSKTKTVLATLALGAAFAGPAFADSIVLGAPLLMNKGNIDKYDF